MLTCIMRMPTWNLRLSLQRGVSFGAAESGAPSTMFLTDMVTNWALCVFITEQQMM